MAKQQSFADKSKSKSRSNFVTVKYVKAIKTDRNSYKFQEKFVQLTDYSKVTDLK